MAIRRLYTAPDRVMVLRKYFSGTSIRKVSRDTNIPKSTIHDWIKKIVSHSPRSREKRRLKHYVGRYNDVVPWIANRLNENPFETLSSLQHALHSKEGVSVSVSTIQRLIRKSGYSYQTVSWRAPSRNVQDELRGFFDAYNAFLSQGYDIVALDETGFVSTKYQRKGYGIRGKCLRVSKQQHGKRQKVSSIVAIGTNGLMFHHSFPGNANGAIFNEFIDDLFSVLDANTVVILDNIAFHKSKYVTDAAERMGIHLLFIPPYSPECNPVENFFSVCKHVIRRRLTCLSTEEVDLLGIVNRVMTNLQDDHDFGVYWGERDRETCATTICM